MEHQSIKANLYVGGWVLEYFIEQIAHSQNVEHVFSEGILLAGKY